MLSQGLIRWLDRYPGALICWLLTLVRRLTDPLRGRPGDSGPHKILFLKLIEQGATVLAYESLRRAADRVGRENVYFCVFKENRFIVDLLELVPPQNVIEVRADKGLVTFGLDCLRMMARCRREGIDTTIDMEFLARAPALLAFLSGARIRVGLHRFTSEAPYRGDLLTHRVHYNPYLHTADSYALLVDALDRPANEVPLLKVPTDARAEIPRFQPEEEARHRVLAVLEEQIGTAAEGPIVLLNSNAGDLLPLRRWGSDRFVELGKRLLEQHSDVTIALTGAPGERAAAERLAEQIGSAPRVISLAGKTTLSELLVIYSLADVLVTNDSGPGHFASLTDIHNIVLFGPETPQLFGPRGGRPQVIWAGLACSPCVNVFNHRRSPCDDNVCMQSLQVEEVYQTVASCLQQVREEGVAAQSTESESS